MAPATDSDWLEPAEAFDMLAEAHAGNRERLSAFVAESRLRCASADCSSFVLVRNHKAYLVKDDLWADLNLAPEPADTSRQVINFARHNADGSAVSGKLPVPFEQVIVEVKWEGEHYVFHLAGGRIRATPEQIHRATADSVMGGFGQTEAAIAHNFGKIDGTVPIEHLGPAIDWAAVRAKLPIAIEDGVLGTLTRQSEDTAFHTTIEFEARRVSISVEVDGDARYATSLGRAAFVVARLGAYAARAKSHAVHQLLEVKNAHWLDDDEKPLGPQEFEAQLGLSGISFDPEGGAVFDLDDGTTADRLGLFCGHSIVARLDANDAFVSADLFG